MAHLIVDYDRLEKITVAYGASSSRFFVVLDFLIDRPWKDKNWYEDELAQKKNSI